MTSSPPRLMYVTDSRSAARSVVETARAAVAGGCDAVQLREAAWTDRRVLETALVLRDVATAGAARLFVNERVDLALASGADGVHLKAKGLDPAEVRAAAVRAGAPPGFMVGVAAHDPGEILTAVERGADYVTVGPLRDTGGKRGLGLRRLGLLLEAARAEAGRPLAWLALGGVAPGDVEGLATLARPGETWGIAAIRLFQDPPAAATQASGSEDATTAVARRVAVALGELRTTVPLDARRATSG